MRVDNYAAIVLCLIGVERDILEPVKIQTLYVHLVINRILLRTTGISRKNNMVRHEYDGLEFYEGASGGHIVPCISIVKAFHI